MGFDPSRDLGGLSKFHTMPIFTVQAVKVRKIFGMWVKLFSLSCVKKAWLPWKFHAVKKFIMAVKIFHAVKNLLSPEKICSYRENILLFHFININHSILYLQCKFQRFSAGVYKSFKIQLPALKATCYTLLSNCYLFSSEHANTCFFFRIIVKQFFCQNEM